MKILINYDFLNDVKNVNENYTPFKVIRNSKEEWMKYNLPIFTGFNLIITNFDVKRTISILSLQFIAITACNYAIYSATKPDVFSIKSELALRDLVRKFKDNNFNTSFELLKESELYDKKYEIRLNENKIPEMIQSKYILVPYQDYIGNINKASLLQEHIMGSKEYVLSLGSPKKVYKPALSNI